MVDGGAAIAAVASRMLVSKEIWNMLNMNSQGVRPQEHDPFYLAHRRQLASWFVLYPIHE